MKGWNFHKNNKSLLVVPYGKVEFMFVDGRVKSKTYYKKEKIILSKKNYKIIALPPGVWFCFKSLTKLSIVANCINNPHQDKETLKAHREGLIVASACLGGEIPQAILRDRHDVAMDVAAWYKDVFGDDRL